MQPNKIVLLDITEDFFEEKYLQKLKSLSTNLCFIDSFNQQRTTEEIQDAQIILVKYFTRVTKEIIDHAPHLKYIGTSSISFSQIDVDFASSKNITVTNTQGYCDNSIAEFIFAALLSHARALEKARDNVKQNNFNEAAIQSLRGFELKGKTFGIIGLGNIRKRTADLALGFGMDVLYFSKTRKRDYEEKGLKYVSLEDLAKQSDSIGIFLPSNASTKDLLSKELLLKIKK